MNSLKIVFIAAEVDPFSKQGGIADVSRSLPKALQRLGHQVTVVTPFYGAIDKEKHNLEQIVKGFPIRMSEKTILKTDFWRGYLQDNLPVYFIDHPKFFSGKNTVYKLRDMTKNGERYYYFCSAVLHLLRFKNIRPDIIHANDWQTALVPYFVKKRFRQEELFNKTACFFTIHNLMFQGATNWWENSKEHQDTGHTPLASFDDKEGVKYINFMKRGIIRSDIVNTVSEQYAKEIITKEFGLQMYRLLSNKKKEDFADWDFRFYWTPKELGLAPHQCRGWMVRDRAFKYWHFNGVPDVLFDLQNDPQERCNVASDPAYASVVQHYLLKLIDWRMANEDVSRVAWTYERRPDFGQNPFVDQAEG